MLLSCSRHELFPKNVSSILRYLHLWESLRFPTFPWDDLHNVKITTFCFVYLGLTGVSQESTLSIKSEVLPWNVKIYIYKYMKHNCAASLLSQWQTLGPNLVIPLNPKIEKSPQEVWCCQCKNLHKFNQPLHRETKPEPCFCKYVKADGAFPPLKSALTRAAEVWDFTVQHPPL